MVDIHIDLDGKIAVYKQLVSGVVEAIKKGDLKPGDSLPSMSELSDSLNISKETVKIAYKILREKGYAEGYQGKGYFIADSSNKDSVSVLFLIDKLSTYKQDIVRGFNSCISEKCELTILLFNQDISLFEYYINESLGNYDYYVITPHFPLDKETRKRAIKNLRRIPNNKLIVLDYLLDGIKGNYGAVYQDFKQDAYDVLTKNKSLFLEYKSLNIITLPNSLYGSDISNSVKKFCKEQNIKIKLFNSTPKTINKGDVFLVINSQLDMGLSSLFDLANDLGLQVGVDYFIISYNDSPIDKLVLNGLTTISTDFYAMGEEAAKMVNQKQMWKRHMDFRINKRFTF